MRPLNAYCFCALALVATAMAEDAVLQIGETKYTARELESISSTEGVDPVRLVPVLRARELGRQLGATGRDLDALYGEQFGEDYRKDGLRASDPDIPPMLKKGAVLRRSLFDAWIGRKAEREIPVKYLDAKGFWAVMKDSESYRIREEAGREMSFEDLPYTQAELQVGGRALVASRGGKPWLRGTQFNTYVTENYRSCKAFLSRGRPVATERATLARQCAQRRLVLESLCAGDVTVPSALQEKTIDSYVKDKMLLEGFDPSGLQFKTISQLNEALYERFQQRHGDEVALLRRTMNGEVKSSLSVGGEIAVRAGEAAVQALQREISSSIPKEEVYDWMKEVGFRGTPNEARMQLGAQCFQERMNERFKAEMVEIASLSD